MTGRVAALISHCHMQTNKDWYKDYSVQNNRPNSLLIRHCALSRF